MADGQPILEFDKVSVHYGMIKALHGISFSVTRGQIVTLIGSNGAGKTTTLKAASGLLKVTDGAIRYKGQTVSNTAAHEIVKKGLCHAPEGRGIFLNLTVEENLDLGAWAARDKSLYNDILAHVYELFPRLKERRSQISGTLSGGEQQMLAIGRALMSQPEVLLLDEPSLGLAPQIIERIFSIIQQINRDGKTILLVEQNALQALQIASYGLVLETGRVTIQGPAQELLRSDEIRKAYLGS